MKYFLKWTQIALNSDEWVRGIDIVRERKKTCIAAFSKYSIWKKKQTIEAVHNRF